MQNNELFERLRLQLIDLLQENSNQNDIYYLIMSHLKTTDQHKAFLDYCKNNAI